MKELVYVLVAATTWLLVSCGEAFFEDDEVWTTMTKSALNDGYLDLSTYNLSEMSESDFQKIRRAEIRMGVFRNEDGFYAFKESDTSKINVSAALFKFVTDSYEGTNREKRYYNQRYPRTKSRSSEVVINDCVPTAISK